MDQFDLRQVVPRQVITPYSCLLISTSFVVVSHIGHIGHILDLDELDQSPQCFAQELWSKYL